MNNKKIKIVYMIQMVMPKKSMIIKTSTMMTIK